MNDHQWSRPARYITFVLLLLFIVLVGWYIRELYQPLIIAGLIAYILMPAVNYLKVRLRMSHKLAVVLVYTISLTMLLAIPATLIPFLLSDLETLSGYLIDIVDQFQTFLSQPFQVGIFEINPEPYIPDLVDTVIAALARLPENALHLIEATSRNFLWLLVIVVTILYLLLDWEKLRGWMVRQAPRNYREDAERLFLDIKLVWAAYLRGTLALMFIVGVVFSILWLAIGLPGALVIGILMGLLSIIPELGPMIGALLSVAVAWVEGSNYLPLSNIWFALLVLGIYTLLINVKNIWLRPRIMGRSVHMHEGLVFVAIIAAVIFQGVLGALIIVPVLASAVVVGRYLRHRIYAEPPFPPHNAFSNRPGEEKKPDKMPKEKPGKEKPVRKRTRKG